MATKYTVVPGGVTAARGFLAAGVAVGVKPGSTKKDVALIVSESPAAVAGVFTTNKVKAAPVVLSMEHVASGHARAVVANSGNANACTGADGLDAALAMAEGVAAGLGLASAKEVIVASTGVIGVPLPVDRVLKGIETAIGELSKDGSKAAAQAIMTTDTFSKELAVMVDIGGYSITLGGIAKGSGMIHPNMATMLGFITTDAAIGPAELKSALTRATDVSFNVTTVDGDTSTNDMVVILANGQAGNPEIKMDTPEYQVFTEALVYLSQELAKMIARDGEGATKFLEVRVSGASTESDARKAAIAVAKSSLVKTAVFGEDANWGRILAAVGYSGAEFNPDGVDIFLGDLQVASGGQGLAFDEDKAKQVLSQKEIVISIIMKDGTGEATAWGCDLSYDYVKINGSYRT